MEFDSIIYSINDIKVLRGVYLKIPKGSIVGVFGENGSGKSTLIKIGAGVLKPDDGNVFINKKHIEKDLTLKRYNYIAYLSQDSMLPKDLSLNSLFEDIPQLENVVKEDSLLSKLKNQKIRSLSGGELKYLEIQLLFCLEREYYLLDEPFTGIEPIYIEKISEFLLIQKSKNKGILITDHYHRYVTEIVESAYLIKNGYIKEIGKSNSVKSDLIEQGYIPDR